MSVNPTKDNSNILWQEALTKELDKNGIAAFVGVLGDMRDEQQETNKTLNEMIKREAHRDLKMEEMFDGFPGKDPAAHKRYHELLIENTIAKKRLTDAIKEKTISGLVFSLIGFIGLCIWNYVMQKAQGK